MLCYVKYVCKHKQKDILGTFGSALERLEAFGKYLNAFRAFLERMGAFGRLVSIIPYGIVCMVWYGMVCMYVNNIKHESIGIQIGRSDPYIDNVVLFFALKT